MYNNKATKYVHSMDEMNEIIDKALKWKNCLYQRTDKIAGFPINSYEITMTQFKLYTSSDWKECKPKDFKEKVYVFDLTGNGREQYVSGITVYRALQQTYKAPDLSKDFIVRNKLLFVDDWHNFSLGIVPTLGYNEKYTNQEIYSYEYDLNSAYAAALIKPIPDTANYRLLSIVKEGEIGFIAKDELQIVGEGEFADFVMPLIESPYKDYVDRWYERKANAVTAEEKQIAKDYLNYGIGYLQRKNPFIRATVINNCNRIIEDLIDENTILWNTDAIYSTKPRPELTIGKGLGEWKLEHEGLIRYKGLEYQVVGERPHYRGIPRAWFSEDFNLLEDELPQSGNQYYFDKELNRIGENKPTRG